MQNVRVSEPLANRIRPASLDEAREIEAMASWGMPLIDALRSATSVDSNVLRQEDHIGRVTTGLFADLIALDRDPTHDTPPFARCGSW